jgi:glycosyltransferase involved in cell wall biosynthesis
MGGAELCLKEFARLFPDAPILTLFADPGAPAALGFDPLRLHSSYLARIPRAMALRKYLVPLFADAIQTLDVGNSRVVLSGSHAVAKSIPHRSYQRLVAYVYTPMRYAHDLLPEYLRSVPALFRPYVRSVLRRLAAWDVATAARVHTFVAISRVVAERIWHTYRRRAEVVYPPVEIGNIPLSMMGGSGDYYVLLSRLVRYKRFDVAVRAAALAQRRLVVIGDGPERQRLQAIARAEGASQLIEFVGRVPHAQKYELLGDARALLFPGEEDFGIVGVEALASGTPVIAYGRGGMLDVVGGAYAPLLSGPPRLEQGGVVFASQTPEDLVAAMRVLESSSLGSPNERRALAEQFDAAVFRSRILEIVDRAAD